MTTQCLDRDCDFSDVGFSDVGPGPWITYARELHAKRERSDQWPNDFETFRELVDSWRTDTWYKSSLTRRVSHPAYLKIIGFGPKAVPWILQELRQEPDYWFAALEAITRENPAPNATTMHELRDAWLAWGEQRAY
jgi:hypothetical protein